MDRFENPLEKRKFKKGTATYWKLKGIVNEALQEQNKCCICGYEKNLVVHHVIKCESDEVLYVNPDNLIVMCNKCHATYHRIYSEVNPKTLVEFILARNEKKKKKKSKKSKHGQIDKNPKYYFINWRRKNENINSD